jgi:hypothetical protein
MFPPELVDPHCGILGEKVSAIDDGYLVELSNKAMSVLGDRAHWAEEAIIRSRTASDER